jgi:hypothetical protein
MYTFAFRQVHDGFDVLSRRGGSEQNVMRSILLGEIRLLLGRGGSNDIRALVIADLRCQSYSSCIQS